MCILQCKYYVCGSFSTEIISASSSQASDLEGEIDLTKCYNVSEYQVQRNYGFQIHVRPHNATSFTKETQLCHLLINFVYFADTEGRLHTVSHDCRDTQELDPVSDEKCASISCSRCGQVKSCKEFLLKNVYN